MVKLVVYPLLPQFLHMMKKSESIKLVQIEYNRGINRGGFPRLCSTYVFDFLY